MKFLLIYFTLLSSLVASDATFSSENCFDIISAIAPYNDKRMDSNREKIIQIIKNTPIDIEVDEKKVEKWASYGWAIEDVIAVKSLLKGVDHMIDGHLIIPQNKTMLPREQLNNAEASTDFNFIRLPIEFRLLDKFKRENKEHIYPVWIHEYGHLIFSRNFETSPLFADVFKDKVQDKALAENIGDFISKFENLKNKLSDIKRQKAKLSIEEIQGQLQDTTLALKKEKKKNFLKRISLPHNELFADLVAVVFLSDGKALVKAFADKSHLTNVSSLTNSEIDIVNNYLEKTAKNRDFTTAHDFLKHNEKGPHNLFGPIRKYIYKWILTGEQNLLPGEILQKTLNAILIDVKRLYDQNIIPGQNEDPRISNSYFFKALKKEFDFE